MVEYVLLPQVQLNQITRDVVVFYIYIPTEVYNGFHIPGFALDW